MQTQILIPIGFTILGVICIGISLHIGYSPSIYTLIDEDIAKKRQLKRNTEQFDRWEEWPHPRKFKVFIFNVTNPSAILANGAKPKVQEVGPFVYNLFTRKKDIRYFAKDDAFTYTRDVYLQFVREESAYDENQKVTVLNLLLLDGFVNETFEERIAKTFQTGGRSNKIELLWAEPFQSKQVFVTVPARKFAFVKYRFCDRKFGKFVILTGKDVGSDTKKKCERKRFVTLNPTARTIGTAVTFSMFRHKSTTEDFFRVSAGVEDITTLANIKSWNNRTSLDIWIGLKSSCNKIRGRDTEIYPPFSDESTVFHFYDDALCRTLTYKADDEVVFKGMYGIKATMGPENLRNDGENSCYCTKATVNLKGERECLPNGFCDMGRCFRSPIIISFPHMLWADERYRNTIDGLQPDEAKHKSFFSVEARSGIPLQSRKRIQYNTILRANESMPITQEIRPSVLPLLWVEECFDLSDNLMQKVDSEYVNKLYLFDIAIFSLFGAGMLSIFIANMLFYYTIIGHL